jgi:hypothetical protein
MHAEPLSRSCDWIAVSARWTCRWDAGTQCAWYHGSWQWLRLLDLVSNPSWHGDFFGPTLRVACSGLVRPRVLVSGCADYSMYAHVAEALGRAAMITALDLSHSPSGDGVVRAGPGPTAARGRRGGCDDPRAAGGLRRRRHRLLPAPVRAG